MIHFYHPNKAVKGFAASFWYAPDDTVFATLIKQFGWDAANGNGTFKESLKDINMKVNAKLSFTEVAAIMDCIERNRPFEAFHDSEDRPKSISFVPWHTKGDAPIQKGFSFSITVKDKQDSTYANSFYIGLTFAEARELREFLIFTMHQHFATRTAELAKNRRNRDQSGRGYEHPLAAAPAQAEETGNELAGI